MILQLWSKWVLVQEIDIPIVLLVKTFILFKKQELLELKSLPLVLFLLTYGAT